MAPTLYTFAPSMYCRAVLMGAKAVGEDLETKTVNLFQKEQLKPEFLAINPQHTVPTLVDGDLTLTESRGILTYLVTRYGKDDSLYPKDVNIRAKIDNILFFDCSTITPRWRAVVRPVMYSTGSKFDEEALKSLYEALGWLEGTLAKYPENTYFAGTPQMTVADISLVAFLSTYEAVGFSLADYPRLAAWLARCKENIKGYKELNEAGAVMFAEKVNGLIKSRS